MRELNHTYKPPSVRVNGELYLHDVEKTRTYNFCGLSREEELGSVLVVVKDDSQKNMINHMMRKPWKPFNPETEKFVYSKRKF